MARNSRSQVLQKVWKYWPKKDPREIMKILDQYGERSFETGVERVQLGILKLCNGDLDQLEELVQMAKADFRDILAYAEYPEELNEGFVRMGKKSEEEAKEIRQRDIKQYLDWLEE